MEHPTLIFYIYFNLSFVISFCVWLLIGFFSSNYIECVGRMMGILKPATRCAQLLLIFFFSVYHVALIPAVAVAFQIGVGCSM